MTKCPWHQPKFICVLLTKRRVRTHCGRKACHVLQVGAKLAEVVE
jgi:hypothetical protein